jgi:hypothetical protein
MSDLDQMDIYTKVDWAIFHGNMGPQSYKVMLEVRAELARLTRENEELRAERDKWKSEWAAAIVAIVGVHRLTSEAHAQLERTNALMIPTPGGPHA